MGTALGMLRVLLLACAITAAAIAAGVAAWPGGGAAPVASAPGARPSASSDAAPGSSGASAAPVRVERPAAVAATALRSWDERRAAAWATGDLARLRALYADGSAAGRADARMLRAWVDRGLRVRGLVTQFLGVELVEDAPDRMVVEVRERVVRAAAVGSGVRRRLEQPAPETRIVELVRVAGAWRVGSVSLVPD